MKKINGVTEGAAARPWRIEHISKLRGALIKGADNSFVAVCHADNAQLIVEAVNAMKEGVPTDV